MDRRLIDAYAAGGERLRAVVAGLTDAQLDARPADGSWTIREIVLHLLDSDLVASDRMRRVIAMEEPQLLAYDENAFAAKLGYARLDAKLAAEVFAGLRALTAATLRVLPDSAFERIGHHNENGPMTLASLVQNYCKHLDHHLAHLERKRGMQA